MMDYRIVMESASHIAEAANKTCLDLEAKCIEHEPQFTDRMLGRISEAMDNFEVKGVMWRAKTLTSLSPAAQEAQYGADFMGVLEINLPNYSVKKGFLAQAKMEHRIQAEFNKLRKQCEQMLTISPDSFVFVYSCNGIYIIPAIAVVSSETYQNIYYRYISTFFMMHLECFVGDRKISSPIIDVLDVIRKEYNARSLLHLSASIVV